MLELMKKALLEGYASSRLDMRTIFACLALTALVSLYISVVYRIVNKNSFYDRSFRLSMFCLSVVTAMVILTIQSNIVVSLGMVGALSIVRFRTAIKNPMDLVFLFWAISAGIICGAGYAIIAVVGSIVLTMGIAIFGLTPGEKESEVLVVNSSIYNEKALADLLNAHCSSFRVRARTLSHGSVNMAIEVKCAEPAALLEAITAMEGISSASLVAHDGDVTA